jgi:acetyl esterase/lipase
MNPVFEKFEAAPWLEHTTADPSAYATEVALPELKATLAEYPMAPGIEIESLDDSTPPGVTRTDIEEKSAKLYLYQRDSLTREAEPRIIYYVHGGGFVRGNGKYCRKLAILHVTRTGLPAAACEYRTAPASAYPDALDDVYAGYRYLTGELGYAPGDIIVAGDSAGGTLAIALLNRLKRLGEALPQKLVLYSPCVDFALNFESHTYNVGKDLIFTVGLTTEGLMGYIGGADLKDPELSPYYGDFTGFPPAYFCVEDTEVLCSDTLMTAEKMYAQGVDVRVHAFHGLWHVFPVYSPETEESKQVFDEVKAFIG